MGSCYRRPAVQAAPMRSSAGCPPPERGPPGRCPSPLAHGCQPPHSRRDPVIPRPPPRPLPRLAHWCWLRKATFQRPPTTPCQPRILGRAGGGGAGDGRSWGGLWEEPESEHLSTGCERKQARAGADPAPPQGLCASGLLTHPPTGAWAGGSVSDTAFLKRHILFRWQSSSSHLL